MLRLIHNQTVVGALLVDDIDDGLPNKEVYRLGSQADKKAYARDGYANSAKQSCYVPYNRKAYGYSAVQGYVNVNQTPRVVLSAGKGKIYKLQKAGLITVVSLTSSQIAAPTATVASVGTSNVSIGGSTLTSVSPDVTSVTFAKGSAGTTPAPTTLTTAQITAAGGSVTATTITIPLSAFTTAPVVNNTVTVTANEQTTSAVTIGGAPTISAGSHGPPVALTGTNFVSTSPDVTSVTFAQGTGATAPSPLTLTSTQITAAGGSVSATSISIPASAFTTAPVTNNTAYVTADAQNSNTFTLT